MSGTDRAVLLLIGRRGRTSPAWLEAVTGPIATLERAGLRGAKLARTHLWLTETTLARVMQETAMALPEQLLGARSALRAMAPERRALLAPLLAQLGDIDADETFAFATERTIDGAPRAGRRTLSRRPTVTASAPAP